MLTHLPEVNVQWHLKWLMEFAGIEFGKESETLIVDIVRYVVVNVTPTNETIHSNTLQRYTLIGHLISQQKHQLHQSYVLQALFIDWLYYDEKQPDSIMLVEPGMLLIYRSADKHPRMTDMLVEYLFDYVNIYDPGRVDEAFLSVQRVLIDCESKGVVQSVKSYLINHPKLAQQTQLKLKKLYRGGNQAPSASAVARQGQHPGQQTMMQPHGGGQGSGQGGVAIKDETSAQTMNAMSGLGGADQPQQMMGAGGGFGANPLLGDAGRMIGAAGAAGNEDFEDLMMANDDELNMSGQFSPPHEPEAPRGFTAGNKLEGADMAEIDSPYASNIETAPMLLNQGSPANSFGESFGPESRRGQPYDINANFQAAQIVDIPIMMPPSQGPAGAAYNIDLFSGNEPGAKSAGTPDAEMATASAGKKEVKQESDSGGSNDSSGSSNSPSGSHSSDDDDAEDSEMVDEDGSRAENKRENIEVPASVIQRFFTKQTSLTSFIQKPNQETTHAMLDVSIVADSSGCI